jgi:hypothetical protein
MPAYDLCPEDAEEHRMSYIATPLAELPCPALSRLARHDLSGQPAWYRRLAEGGQHPRAMVISCCDSRVHVTSIFGADEGEFFIHRNIANLVPPYERRTANITAPRRRWNML